MSYEDWGCNTLCVAVAKQRIKVRIDALDTSVGCTIAWVPHWALGRVLNTFVGGNQAIAMCKIGWGGKVLGPPWQFPGWSY